MKKIVLIGAGGNCKVVIDILRSIGEYEIVGVTDKVARGNAYNDIPILGDDSLLTEIYYKGIEYAFVSVGAINNLGLRNDIFKKLKMIGFNIPVLIHRTAIVSPSAKIAEGSCIMPGAIINSDVIIGRNCIINSGSVIEHDCKINSNTHVSPNVTLSGGVIIGESTHVGVGSSIIQGISIGNNVTIGAGAVITKNIESNVVVAGVPAKIIKYK